MSFELVPVFKNPRDFFHAQFLGHVLQLKLLILLSQLFLADYLVLLPLSRWYKNRVYF